MLVAGTRIKGLSIGSVGTSLVLPQYKIAFDIGRCVDSTLVADTVFLTHGHMDHIGAIAAHCARRELRGLGPTTYYMAPDLIPHVRALFEAFRVLDGSKLAATLKPISVGEQVTIGRNAYVEPFPVDHVMPTQGYCVWKATKSLRPEFQGLPQAEVKALAIAGEQVSETNWSPDIAFCGDTRISVLDKHEFLRRVRILILECTFLDDRVPADKAHRTFHVHLDHLNAATDKLADVKALVLTHFSARYTAEEVGQILPESLNDSLRPKAHLFFDHFSER